MDGANKLPYTIENTEIEPATRATSSVIISNLYL